METPLPPQVIPRPPGALPGRPAPWAGLSSEQRRGLTLERVLGALERGGQRGPVPAEAVPEPGEPWERTPAPEPLVDRGRLAAVLVALYEVEGETRVLLTRRSENLRSHTSQVAFPGGRLEPGERPEEAALREAAEEVALDPSLVEVVGWLHTLSTVAGSSTVVPVVGALSERPAELVPNPKEVARVFDVALAELLAEEVFHEERWSVPEPVGRQVIGRPGLTEGRFPVWFFEVAGDTVWGATARMLMELLCLVLGLEPPGA